MMTTSEILAKSASIMGDRRLTRFRILIDDEEVEYRIREVVPLPPFILELRRGVGGIWVRLRLSLLISFGDKFSPRWEPHNPPQKEFSKVERTDR